MNEAIELAATGFAIAAAPGASVPALRWIVRQRTQRSAALIARSQSTDEGRLRMTWAPGRRLERDRLSRVRAKPGASSALVNAAAELVQEHWRARLDRR
jgi:hypothetical protein